MCRSHLRKWKRAENPIPDQEYEHQRRVADHGGKVFVISSRDIARHYGKPCYACDATDRVTTDHLIPVTRGGSHGIGNVIRLCLSCNQSKSGQTWSEWKYSRKPRANAIFGKAVTA